MNCPGCNQEGILTDEFPEIITHNCYKCVTPRHECQIEYFKGDKKFIKCPFCPDWYATLQPLSRHIKSKHTTMKRHIPLPSWIKWSKSKGQYILIGLKK